MCESEGLEWSNTMTKVKGYARGRKLDNEVGEGHQAVWLGRMERSGKDWEGWPNVGKEADHNHELNASSNKFFICNKILL